MKLVAAFLALAAASLAGVQAQATTDAQRHAEVLDAIDLAGLRAQFPNRSPEWVSWYFRATQTAQRAYQVGTYESSPEGIVRKIREQNARQSKLDALDREEAELKAQLAVLDAAERTEAQKAAAQQQQTIDALQKQNADLSERLKALEAKSGK